MHPIWKHNSQSITHGITNGSSYSATYKTFQEWWPPMYALLNHSSHALNLDMCSTMLEPLEPGTPVVELPLLNSPGTLVEQRSVG